MRLANYLKTLTPEQRKTLALRVGTSREYLVQLAGGHRLPSPDMAKRLEQATHGQVGRHELRPDIWESTAA